MDCFDDAVIAAIFTGKAAMRWPGRPPSAIGKTRVSGKVWLSSTGIVGDEQADLSVHGGTEKALHQYAPHNYAVWKRQLPEMAATFVAGAFGENISSGGLSEETICIGDIFRIGGAVVQVTQGRQPCWKLASHIEQADMVARVQKSGLTGWYYRVLEEGHLEQGDRISLAERPQPQWPLAHVIAARFNPALEAGEAERLAGITQMSRSWHGHFVKKCDPTYRESTAARVIGS